MYIMLLLLPPKEDVLARRFCEMIHHVSLVKDERIVLLSVKEYLDKLCSDGMVAQATAIKNELKRCNPRLAGKLYFK